MGLFALGLVIRIGDDIDYGICKLRNCRITVDNVLSDCSHKWCKSRFSESANETKAEYSGRETISWFSVFPSSNVSVTHLSNPCSNKSPVTERASAERISEIWWISQVSTSDAFQLFGGSIESPPEFDSTAPYLQSGSVSNTTLRHLTYNSLISVSYNASAAFFATVPFPTRGRGFSGLTMRIISLKIRLKEGAILFASSIAGLFELLVEDIEYMYDTKRLTRRDS